MSPHISTRRLLSTLLLSLFFLNNTRTLSAVLSKEGAPRTEIITIFRKLGFPESAEPTLSNLNAYGQEHFLRPAKSERLSPEAIEFYHRLLAGKDQLQKQELLRLFESIGDTEEIRPSGQPIDYVLIMGSTVGSMRERLMFLARLFENREINAKKTAPIVFLTGDRDLFTSETPEVLVNPKPFKARTGYKAPKELPTNENQLGELIWEQLQLPKSLRAHTPIFVKAPRRESQKRAQTKDTVEAWLDDYQVAPGHCLIISSNPFVSYQELVTRLVFKQVRPSENDFTFEAVGAAARKTSQGIDADLGTLLDNLARTLFTQEALQKQKRVHN